VASGVTPQSHDTDNPRFVRVSGIGDLARVATRAELIVGGPAQNRGEREGQPDRTMANELELAKYTLFDSQALGANNVKLFPGSSREITPHAIAEQVNRSIADILAGNFELLDDTALD